jgi:hypothetical protein
VVAGAATYKILENALKWTLLEAAASLCRHHRKTNKCSGVEVQTLKNTTEIKNATGIDGWLGGDFDRPHT